MTEEEYKRATDIRKRNEMLNKLKESIKYWAISNKLDCNDASMGYAVRHLIIDDEKAHERFWKYLNNEITICEEDFKSIVDDGWVSVEDALPEYDEDVLVCGTSDEDDFGFWAAHRTQNEEVLVDDNDFAMLGENYPQITHWRRINPPKK